MIRPGSYHPRSTAVFLVSAALLISGSYLIYELGRYYGGYSLLDQREERLEAETALADRDAIIEGLRRQVTLLEVSAEIDRETYSVVEKNLSQLQARIQVLEGELVFYQGIVSPEDGISGLRIQNLEVSAGDSEQRYTLRMVLVQAISQDLRVAGVVRFNIAGTRDGQPVELDLGDLVADDSIDDLAYAFRYFQDLEEELVLPVGFEPNRIDVEIWPREPRGEQVSQSFQWSAIVT